MFLTPRRITHWVGLWASTALVPTAALAQSITPATDGTGTQINQNGDRYTITGGSAAGNNLFHSFQEFNLNGAEAANFLAAPTVENILGRIRGGNPTVIDGLLQVTGTQANLYLMNPAGVLFGPNARLDLPAAFGVTTADGIGFSNGWFSAFGDSDYAALVGDPTQFAFTQATPGPIVNAGQLRVESGESIMLLGGSVINTGTLSAPGGEVTIAAIPGESLVRISHDGLLLNLEVEAIASNAAIAPSPITPSTLPELLTGGIPSSATGITLNPDGTVTLSGSEIAAPVEPGTTLVAGTVDVADPLVGSGGAINLLGQTVGVLAAQVEASGAAGGGDIRIGGGYQGREAVPNAEMTVISEGATVRADALSNGNGGRVIVWSDLATRIYGDLSAIGGALGGNGGLIETSSLGQLDIQTAPDVSAAQGNGGTWLIDPPTLVIGALASSNLENSNPIFRPLNSGIDSVLSIDTLTAALAPDNITVIISTTSTSGVGGDIVFNQPLFYDAGNNSALVLQAAENINIDAAITAAAGSPLSLTFQADTDFTGNGQVQINNNILTSGGSITATGNTTALGAEPAIAIASGVNINTGVGDINLTALGSGGGIQANSPLVSTGGNVNLNAANTSIAVQDINSGSGNISATTQGDLTVGNILSGGRVELTSSNANIQANTVNATAGSGPVLLSAASGFIQILDSFTFSNGSASVASNGGPISIAHGGNGQIAFTVGDASQNGSAAAIANSSTAFNFAPTEEILFTTTRNGVSIESIAPPPPPPPSLPPGSPSFVNVECLPDCREENLTVQPNLDRSAVLGAEAETPVEIEQRIRDIETAFTQDFASYLGLEEAVPIQSIDQGQQRLQEIVQTAGTTPAIIYVAFTPTASGVQQATKPVIQPETEDTIQLASGAQAGLKADSEYIAQSNQPQQPTDQLELILVTPGQDPVRVRLPEVTRSQMLEVAGQLRREVTDRTRRRTTSYLAPAQQLYDWIITPLAPELEAQNVQHISFVLDAGLRSLPIAALHSGNGFIIEQYSVALMPSLSLTDTRYQDVRGAQVLAMGASDFAQLSDLPAVQVELSQITGELWPGEALINDQFTPSNLVEQRRNRPFSLLHLATHGEFNEGSLENSFIQFWDRRVQLAEIRQLQLSDPLVELLVLSACRTALGNTQAELGFAGLAVQTGAKTALASLWLVDDVSAASFMIEFYSALRTTPIRAEALRQAQLAMMRGDTAVMGGVLDWSGGELPLPDTVAQNLGTLSHPYFWSAFTMIGSPW